MVIFSNSCYQHRVCFSSCQSKVNNPSYNELDSTNTSVAEVDSAAIIAEQKQKEAEKAAEAEKVQKQKEELERLAKNFKQQKDEFSDKTWIFPKDKPKYRNRNATYCYFMKQNNEVKNFRFVFQYVASDWLFIKDLIFNIDGKIMGIEVWISIRTVEVNKYGNGVICNLAIQILSEHLRERRVLKSR